MNEGYLAMGDRMKKYASIHFRVSKKQDSAKNTLSSLNSHLCTSKCSGQQILPLLALGSASLNPSESYCCLDSDRPNMSLSMSVPGQAWKRSRAPSKRCQCPSQHQSTCQMKHDLTLSRNSFRKTSLSTKPKRHETQFPLCAINLTHTFVQEWGTSLN